MKDPIRRDIVHKIWERSTGEWVSVATIDRLHGSVFRESLFKRRPYPQQVWGTDLFFSALRFREAKRSIATVGNPGILFADLDLVEPDSIAIPPTYAWRTSPGNYQAVWFLDTPWSDYQSWADLNARLTEYTRADSGGWSGSKLLRWPGSANFKRVVDDGVPIGTVVMETSEVYSFEDLDRFIPTLNRPNKFAVALAEMPKLPTGDEAKLTILKNMENLSLRSKSYLFSQAVEDRSYHIVKTIHQLASDGLSEEDIFVMLWWMPWNKWRVRNNPGRLWKEIVALRI